MGRRVGWWMRSVARAGSDSVMAMSAEKAMKVATKASVVWVMRVWVEWAEPVARRSRVAEVRKMPRHRSEKVGSTPQRVVIPMVKYWYWLWLHPSRCLMHLLACWWAKILRGSVAASMSPADCLRTNDSQDECLW